MICALNEQFRIIHRSCAKKRHATCKTKKLMGKQIAHSVSFHLPDGREVSIETGKLATLANGSVVVKCGKTMLFAVVTASPEPKPDQSFFPLSVDYQEKYASVGRVPGNFFRRETRLNDYEVLISRLIDRALRPLFTEGYMNDTQIIINLISADKETQPDAFAALAAAAALAVSDVPLEHLISEVRVARINGEFHINPLTSALKNADLDIIVGATAHNVTMVEGQMKEVQEHDLVEAIKVGHAAIKTQIACLEQLKALHGKPNKIAVPVAEENEEVATLVSTFATPLIQKLALSSSSKYERKNALSEISTNLKAHLLETKGEEWMTANGKFVGKYYDKTKKKAIREVVLDHGVRLDGRKTNEIRPIWCEVDYLPSAHGSAVFNRGETQSLTSLTLGTQLDSALIDTALNPHNDNFLLHYNFPGFSVGEVKPMRAPGRREVGHANLAGRSIRQILPETGYTVRLVSDILESNGSSSMATVCAGSLALMDGGIKIPGHIAGIAMGMITDGGKVTDPNRVAILSDILGDEDALGDMDFKVTGTVNGICGCQMDIKIDGLPYELLEKALIQAREGRLHIIGEMNKVISVSADDLKPHTPRVEVIIIDKDFIGGVIGPGGKIIQEMQRTTGATINIEEKEGKGYVSIYAPDKTAIDAAVARISQITYSPKAGDEHVGKVASVMPYGVFVDFLGSQSGLLHVSEMSWTRIDDVEAEFAEGDEIRFKIIEVDKRSGKMRLSRKAVIPSPDGRPYVATTNESSGGGDRGGDRRGGGGDRRDDRGGRGGDRRDDRGPRR